MYTRNAYMVHSTYMSTGTVWIKRVIYHTDDVDNIAIISLQ